MQTSVYLKYKRQRNYCAACVRAGWCHQIIKCRIFRSYSWKIYRITTVLLVNSNSKSRFIFHTSITSICDIFYKIISKDFSPLRAACIVLGIRNRSRLTACLFQPVCSSPKFPNGFRREKAGTFGISYLLFPCEKATIVPELASSWRSAAAIVNSGTRRSSAAARSKFSSFSRSSLSSPGSSKTQWSMRPNGMRGWSRSIVLNCISYIVSYIAFSHRGLYPTLFDTFQVLLGDPIRIYWSENIKMLYITNTLSDTYTKILGSWMRYSSP